MSWEKSICRPSYTPANTKMKECVLDSSLEKKSPIDSFYDSIGDLVKAGAPAYLASHPRVGALLAVGAISAVELYVRQICGFVLSVCPSAKRTAKEKAIPFGSVFSHRSPIPEMVAFEGLSLSGSSEIKKCLDGYLGFSIKPTSLISTPLQEFDKYCELRHNIVHSSCVVAGKNAVALFISKSGNQMTINIDYAILQEVYDACTALVISINIELFKEVVRRWAVDWPRTLDLTPKDKLILFEKIWNEFHSKVDAQDGSIERPMKLSSCILAVIREYNIGNWSIASNR
jgi:hypothetical protein